MDLMMLSLRSLAGLAAVLAMFALVVWAIKRLNRGAFAAIGQGGGGEIRVCARQALDARHSLVVVEYEGQRWMLGLSAERMTVVDTLGDAGTVESVENLEGNARA